MSQTSARGLAEVRHLCSHSAASCVFHRKGREATATAATQWPVELWVAGEGAVTAQKTVNLTVNQPLPSDMCTIQ